MQCEFRLTILVGVVCFGLIPESLAVVDDSMVVPESRCPDGRIPLNSPQVRCQNLPQLQWAGRKCVNSSDFSCPVGYNCLDSGLCCNVPAAPQFSGDLCRLDPSTSNVVDVNGTCSTDSDCKIFSSPLSKCCSGRCFLLMQRCFEKLKEYKNILSTGQMPRQFLPNCTDDGAFATVQSEPRLGLRWCADPRTGLARRSGCCLPQLDFNMTSGSPLSPSGMCADLRPCPRDLCAMQVCLARPDARCRVNPCGGCRVEFVDSAGRLVDCQTGLSQCPAKVQGYYDGLAWLRARDQTQWFQTNFSNTPVTSNPSLASSLDTCQADTCVPYDASKLEPPVAAYVVAATRPSCPKQNNLNYRCPDRCSVSTCNRSKREICCQSGCGLECTVPDDNYPEAQCQMSISSGRCPAVGCFRMCRRWGYDTARRTCRGFWYAGSGGNNNRYNSWSECMWWVQNCHGRVLLALPVKPQCTGTTGNVNYGNVQRTDNLMYWCTKSDGTPTPGTLHADRIVCNTTGQLVKNRYYNTVSYMFQGRCFNNSWPAWCQDVPADKTCGTPGVTTFADACNACRLVHVNAEGDEVSCQTDAAVCTSTPAAPATGATATAACPPPISAPQFNFSSGTGRCVAVAPSGGASCAPPASGMALPPSNTFSREAGCLQTCASRWCQNATSPPGFYPDLCLSAASRCRWPGAVCVPDECTGRERFVLPNGTEILECSVQLAPLNLTTSAGCSVDTTTASATTSSRVTYSVPASASNVTRGSTLIADTTVQPSTAASTQPSAVATRPTTNLPAKVILPICRLRSQLGVESLRCRTSDGRYEPKQCNATHCFCVVVDSGAQVSNGTVVPLSGSSYLNCPTVETTNLSLSVTYDYEYLDVLPSSTEEAQFQMAVIRKFGLQGGLRADNFRQVDLEPGSIIVTVVLTKTSGDTSVDLPASSFELKTMALKQSLTIDFNGISLAPSARQDFNERSGSSVLELVAASSTPAMVPSAPGLNIAGIVAGVLVTAAAVSVAAVIVSFALRRRTLLAAPPLPHESGEYETMSNASGSSGHNQTYDNFANKVYGPVDEIYDNIARPSASNA